MEDEVKSPDSFDADFFGVVIELEYLQELQVMFILIRLTLTGLLKAQVTLVPHAPTAALPILHGNFVLPK